MAQDPARLPRRRTHDLLSEEVGDEIVVLDGRSGEVHCLTGAAAQVWALCTGAHGAAGIAAITNLDETTTSAVIDSLDDLDLLEPEPAQAQAPKLTRRTIAKRAVQVGAGSMVLSAALPTVASAASLVPNFGPAPNCTAKTAGGAPVKDAECQSGYCYLTHSNAKICAPSATCTTFGGVCVLVGGCCAGNVCTGTLGGLTCAQ
jgi:hypothetical protein